KTIRSDKPQPGLAHVRSLPLSVDWERLLSTISLLCAVVALQHGVSRSATQAEQKRPGRSCADSAIDDATSPGQTNVPPTNSAPSKENSAGEEERLREGRAMFRGLCSGCHGGVGRGGKGPDLTDDRWLHGNKDEDIARVIKNGVPQTTMKK